MYVLGTVFSKWQSILPGIKCTVLSVRNKSQPSVRTYYVNGSAVMRHNSYIDLSITIRQDLSFHMYMLTTLSARRDGRRISILFRCFTSRNCDIMHKAFTACIWPIVEYNTIVWSTCIRYFIDLNESVQRNFSKRMPSLLSFSCDERNAMLNLETLELRRLHFDLMYKVFNYPTPFDPHIVFTVYSIPPPTLLRRDITVPSFLKQ
jgi:hypothetical protein